MKARQKGKQNQKRQMEEKFRLETIEIIEAIKRRAYSKFISTTYTEAMAI